MKSCWRALCAALLGTTSVACINIPPFRGDAGNGDASDASSDAQVVDPGAIATMQGTGALVTNRPLYTVGFSTEPFHFPYSMTVGTNQLVAGGASGCAAEYGVGIGLYPATHVTGHAGTGVMQEDVHIQFAGPPVAKIELDWATQFGCGGTNTGDVSGRSFFTFFPDGRINRGDHVTFGQQLNGSTCNCNGPDNWYVTSFFTTNRSTTSGVFGATLPPDSTSIGNPTQPTICFNGYNNAWQFAMGWRTGYAARVRTPVDGTNGTIAFVYDLTMPGAMSTLGPAEFEGQTTWWVSTSSSCSDLRTKVEPYAANSGQTLPTLNVQPGTSSITPLGVALDGIFGGDNGTGSMGYNSSDAVVHLSAPTGTTLGAFAFWLALSSGDDVVSVTKSPATPAGSWYEQETRVGSNHRLFWFPDGLLPGETITITTQ